MRPSPKSAAALLPHISRPSGDAEVLAFVLRIERLEIRADKHFVVGTCAVGFPDDLACCLIQRGSPTTHAHLATAVDDDKLILRDEGRHRHGFAVRYVA